MNNIKQKLDEIKNRNEQLKREMSKTSFRQNVDDDNNQYGSRIQ